MDAGDARSLGNGRKIKLEREDKELGIYYLIFINLNLKCKFIQLYESFHFVIMNTCGFKCLIIFVLFDRVP